MMHPYVIDTSVIFNTSGERWRKPKLQALAWQFLGLRIQGNECGHDSAEDSISSLKLVQLKLSKGEELEEKRDQFLFCTDFFTYYLYYLYR